MRLLWLAAILGLAAPAGAVQGYIYGPSISTNTGIATEYLAGRLNVSASSATLSTQTISLDGVTGGVNASSFSATYGVKAATGVFSGPVTASSMSVTWGVVASSLNATGGVFAVGGSTINASGGVVTLASTTVTGTLTDASTFYVGTGVSRSTFSAIPGNTTYAADLSSGVHISSGGVTWPNGTTQWTAYAVQNTTVTALRQNVTATVTTPQCVAGTTVTFTTSGNPVVAALVGSGYQVAGNGNELFGILQDGVFLNASSEYGTTSNDINMGMTAMTTVAPSAASHSYCLAVWGSGNFLIHADQSNGRTLQLSVWEVH